MERLEFSILEMGCKLLVVGPAGGRISTAGDCNRVLNVNRSLYSSTSRVERSDMFCERSLYAAPTCTTVEAPVYVYCLYSSLLLEDSTDHYFQFCRMRVSLPAFSGT